MDKLLEVWGLQVNFSTYAGVVQAVRGIDFFLDRGEAIAIVGESGCGKSVTTQAITRLIPDPPGKITGGSIVFNGKNLLDLTEKEMQNIRGTEIGLVLQDPMTSLNPTMTVGKQIGEVLSIHHRLSETQVKSRCAELLTLVGIPDPESRMKQYPHQLSGGQRQRIMIAMALAGNPKLLIADEPTTALDVTIQAQIIDLMKELRVKLAASIILITHDLGIVAGLCSRVLVMYAGKIVESGPVDKIFRETAHPYTKGLLRSIPRLDIIQKEDLSPIPGRPPDLLSPPTGCAFWPRCQDAMRICAEIEPPSLEISASHHAACWLHYNRHREVFGQNG